jgi:hypothetical protein
MMSCPSPAIPDPVEHSQDNCHDWYAKAKANSGTESESGAVVTSTVTDGFGRGWGVAAGSRG